MPIWMPQSTFRKPCHRGPSLQIVAVISRCVPRFTRDTGWHRFLGKTDTKFEWKTAYIPHNLRGMLSLERDCIFTHCTAEYCVIANVSVRTVIYMWRVGSSVNIAVSSCSAICCSFYQIYYFPYSTPSSYYTFYTFTFSSNA